MIKLRIPLFVKVAASLVLLGLVLLRVDFAALATVFASSNWLLILLATVGAFGAWLINTWKWQILLASPGAHLSYGGLLRLNFIGIFYNLVLPGQVGGEVVKGVTLSRMGVSKTASAVSVAADRVTGLLAIFLLGIAGLALAPSGAIDSGKLVPWLLGIGLALAIAAIVLVTGRGPAAVLSVGKALGWSTRRLPQRFSGLASRLALPSRSWSSLVVPLLLSAAFQMLNVFVNLLLCASFGIKVSYLQLLWVVAVVSLAQALPISIAGLGVREGVYVYLLHQLGVSTSSALALSLMVFAIQVVLALTGGVLQIGSHVKKSPPAEKPGPVEVSPDGRVGPDVPVSSRLRS